MSDGADLYSFDNENDDFLFNLDEGGLFDKDNDSSKNEIWNENEKKGEDSPMNPVGLSENRPMTSVAGKGYNPQNARKGSSRKGASSELHKGLKKRSENSAQYKARTMEREVHRLYEESAIENKKGNRMQALEKAKMAVRQEMKLNTFQEENNLQERSNDLSFAVNYNVSQMYYQNQMHHESMEAFQTIVRSPAYDQLCPGRLRVNIGNIHFDRGEFPEAIKNYNMALDQIPPEHHNRMKCHILKNIGNAYFKQRKYDIAANHFEQAMAFETGEIQIVFNLVICYYALGDQKGMKRSFVKLLMVRVPGLTKNEMSQGGKRNVLQEEEEQKRKQLLLQQQQRQHRRRQNKNNGEDDDDDDEYDEHGNKKSNQDDKDKEEEEELNLLHDELHQFLLKKEEYFYDCILKAARLIAEHIELDWEKGYDFIIEKLKVFQMKRGSESECQLADEMEMEKSLKYLKNKQFSKAIESLKAFEKRGDKMQARAATNLSFIYLLEKKTLLAEKYANMAIDYEKFNAKALVNLGICHYMKKQWDKAKDFFSLALTNESDCIEAIFNIGLVSKAQGRYKEALRTFKRLFGVIPDSIEVIWQIADLFRVLDESEQAIEFYTRLITKVKSDPKVLYTLGLLYEQEKDESNSHHYFMESYKYYPVNLEVVQRLGFYYVDQDIYESALEFFERASQIDPTNVDWKLHVGSCLRHLGQHQRALQCYENINKEFPENLECLDRMIHIFKDLENEEKRVFYEKKKREVLDDLEKKKNMKEKLEKEHQKDVGDDYLKKKKQEQIRRRNMEEAKKIKESKKKKKKNKRIRKQKNDDYSDDDDNEEEEEEEETQFVARDGGYNYDHLNEDDDDDTERENEESDLMDFDEDIVLSELYD